MQPKTQQPAWRGLAAGLAGFIIITVALTVLLNRVGAEELQAFIVSAGPAAPLLYILSRMIGFVVAPLSTGAIQFAAGALFGLVPGVIYSLIGELIGGSINFWIARRLGRPVVKRLAGDEGMARIEHFYHQAGDVWALVYARFFLFAAYDFLSYAAGLTPLPYRQYALVTVVAGIVPTFAAVWLGSRLTGSAGQLLGFYAALAVISLVAFLGFRLLRRRTQSTEGSAD